MAGLLRISEAYVLAFHALAYMVASDDRKPVTAMELARYFRVSEAHLAKVLQRLARLGLLVSKRGPGGGFVLGRRPEDVTLLDIHVAVDGPLVESTCLLVEHICKPGTCVMEKLLRSVYDQVHERLGETRLTDLVDASWEPRNAGPGEAAGGGQPAVRG
ncbi:MAG: Rrf2 family transcriptional regulator [Planctomycetes bacterium]|nr:Rrf2 family transcriptional regulator [Planctomycetota bacterium]